MLKIMNELLNDELFFYETGIKNIIKKTVNTANKVITYISSIKSLKNLQLMDTPTLT